MAEIDSKPKMPQDLFFKLQVDFGDVKTTYKFYILTVHNILSTTLGRIYIQGYYIQDIYPITGYMIWIYILLPKWI